MLKKSLEVFSPFVDISLQFTFPPMPSYYSNSSGFFFILFWETIRQMPTTTEVHMKKYIKRYSSLFHFPVAWNNYEAIFVTS